MTRYELLLFLHVAAAIVWLGSGFLFQVLGLRADASGDPVRMKTILDELNALSTRLVGAAVALAAVYSVWRYRDETASRPVRETA